MHRVSLRLAPALLVLCLPSAAVADAAGVAALATWLKEVERGKVVLDLDAVSALKPLLAGAVLGILDEERVETSAAAGPPRPVDGVLLDVAALDLGARVTKVDERDPRGAFAQKARDNARAALVGRLQGQEGELVRAWIAAGVIPNTKQTDGRRIAAVEALAELRDEGTLELLFEWALARKPEGLAAAAREALCGWPDRRVTEFFLGATSLGPTPGKLDAEILARHVAAIAPELSEADHLLVLERVGLHLSADDWREAARALGLLRSLETDAAYPVLIDALETWAARRAGKNGSKRVESDLADELQRRSGRALGTHADRWRNWWSLVEEGKVAPPPKPEEELERTEATFFSLRPSSQKVTFVIDRSESMSAQFGKDGLRTRYEEAVEQTLNYLRVSGEGTSFNVILFSSSNLRYKSRLQQATARNLESLERWLLYNGPEGGTLLRAAVEQALELDRDGSVDLSKLESDTIVVLCDGVTHEGSDWVAPTLDRIHDRAQVVFHCVQIGKEGDGTLEALSQKTGGDYIRIVR